MATLFSRVMNAPRYAYLWMQVRDLVADKEFEKALCLLEDIDKIKPNICPEFYLERGFIFFAIQKDEASKIDFKKALELVPLHKRYSDLDRKYLETYANNLLSKIDKSYSPVIFTEITIEHVSKILRRRFPLRAHPNWQEV